MAKLLQAFNATQFDPTQSAGSLPIGRFPAILTKSEITPVKTNDGGMLVYTVECIDGPHKGASGPYRLNLYNASPKAVEIAQRQFAALCWVTGQQNVEDSAQLHGTPFIMEVGLQRGEEAVEKGYTEVKKVFDINGNEPSKNAAPNIVVPQTGPMTHVGEATEQQPQQTQQQPQQQPQNNAGSAGWGNVASGGTAAATPVASNVQMPQEQAQQPQGGAAGGASWGGAGQQPQGGGAAWGGAGNAQPSPNGQPNGGGWGQRQ